MPAEYAPFDLGVFKGYQRVSCKSLKAGAVGRVVQNRFVRLRRPRSSRAMATTWIPRPLSRKASQRPWRTAPAVAQTLIGRVVRIDIGENVFVGQNPRTTPFKAKVLPMFSV